MMLSAYQDQYHLLVLRHRVDVPGRMLDDVGLELHVAGHYLQDLIDAELRLAPAHLLVLEFRQLSDRQTSMKENSNLVGVSERSTERQWR